ncbi:MAG TPA: DUF58 domain-containing protein, partial [Burkholderiaceae bacterium]|nr:DUF58 domain-containing protein [Burkholderiaceae bacterium]
INYSNSLAYGLAFLLASVAIVSMLSTDRNLLHLRVRAGSSASVFAGEVAVFRVHLVNEAAKPRYGIALMRAKQEIARVDIGAGVSATVELREPSTRRGWLSLAEFHVTTRFPLGILYSWSRRIALDERCLVYPPPSEPWPWRAQAETETAAQARPIAGGDDFSGVREYRPGDSPRQIDWKSAARGRGLLTKEFSAGLSETLWFDLARVPAPDLETRLSMICRAVLDAEQAGLRYGLRLGASVIEVDGGETHQQRCLRALAVYGQDDQSR